MKIKHGEFRKYDGKNIGDRPCVIFTCATQMGDTLVRIPHFGIYSFNDSCFYSDGVAYGAFGPSEIEWADYAIVQEPAERLSKLVYIASPYNHPDPATIESNYDKVARYTAEIVAAGDVAISPIAYGHNLLPLADMPGDWEFWRNFCLSMLSRCDELRVYKIDGWDASSGVRAEIEFAERNGIEITYVEP